jgi:hypothetical protein
MDGAGDVYRGGTDEYPHHLQRIKTAVEFAVYILYVEVT